MKSLKFFVLSACVAAFTLTGCDDDDTTTPDNPSKKQADLYASSNTSGKVSKTEFSEDEDGGNEQANRSAYEVAYEDAEGIYYDSEADVLYQNDRSNNQLRAYTNFSAEAGGTSITTSLSSAIGAVVGGLDPLQNGREIAKSGNKIVVAQGQLGASIVSSFYIYTRTNDSLYLSNIYLSPVFLGGIHMEGNTMYAAVVNSNDVVVFNDFFSNGTGDILTADMTISIEGINNSHGLTYDAEADVMVITDIGNDNSDNDGAFIVITDFQSKMTAAGNGGTIALNDQVRVENSFLGNPVDCAYDDRTRKIYIAERANADGRIMVYDMPSSSGDAAPVYNQTFEGASAIYLAKK